MTKQVRCNEDTYEATAFILSKEKFTKVANFPTRLKFILTRLLLIGQSATRISFSLLKIKTKVTIKKLNIFYRAIGQSATGFTFLFAWNTVTAFLPSKTN